MKTLRNSIIAMCALFVAASCTQDDVEDSPVVQGIDAPVLSAPEEGNVYVLTEDNADLQAERFVWSAANFGAGIIPSYDVEIDFAGQSFDTPVIVASTNGTTQISVSNNVLNNAMNALEATPEEPSTFEVRIKAYVADQVLYSNAVEISVTPYIGFVPLPNLFVVGTATEFGYENNVGNTPLFRDNADQTKFYYTGYFSAGELKLLSNRGAWTPQWGSAGDGVLAVNDGTGSDPSPITVPAAGYYSLEVNTADMTYALTPYDASGAVAQATVGLIGDATPTLWDSDSDMSATTANPHIWHINAVALIAGGAKFRAADAWTVNWGNAAFPAGIATQDGANITVTADTAGTYDVWFNDLDGRYLFIPAN